jgi:hypothetical protein
VRTDLINPPTPAAPCSSCHFKSHRTNTDSIDKTKADPERHDQQLSNTSKTVENGCHHQWWQTLTMLLGQYQCMRGSTCSTKLVDRLLQSVAITSMFHSTWRWVVTIYHHQWWQQYNLVTKPDDSPWMGRKQSEICKFCCCCWW